MGSHQWPPGELQTGKGLSQRKLCFTRWCGVGSPRSRLHLSRPGGARLWAEPGDGLRASGPPRWDHPLPKRSGALPELGSRFHRRDPLAQGRGHPSSALQPTLPESALLPSLADPPSFSPRSTESADLAAVAPRGGPANPALLSPRAAPGSSSREGPCGRGRSPQPPPQRRGSRETPEPAPSPGRRPCAPRAQPRPRSPAQSQGCVSQDLGAEKTFVRPGSGEGARQACGEGRACCGAGRGLCAGWHPADAPRHLRGEDAVLLQESRLCGPLAASQAWGAMGMSWPLWEGQSSLRASGAGNPELAGQPPLPLPTEGHSGAGSVRNPSHHRPQWGPSSPSDGLVTSRQRGRLRLPICAQRGCRHWNIGALCSGTPFAGRPPPQGLVPRGPSVQSSEGAALVKPQGSLPKVTFQSESSPRTDFEEWVRTPSLLLDPPSFYSSARLTGCSWHRHPGPQGSRGTKSWDLPFPPL